MKTINISDIPSPDESWALVELYRWQYGTLPDDNRPISIPEAVRSFVRLLNDGDMSKLPLPFNVSIVLAHVATQFELQEQRITTLTAEVSRLKAEREARGAE